MRKFYRTGMIAGSKIQIGYYLKQLLPLMYFSEYKENEQPKISIWRQWFGRILWHKSYSVNQATS